MTTFGVRLPDHLQETGAQVPPLVCKCVHNIDASGGIKVKGKFDFECVGMILIKKQTGFYRENL